MRTRPSIRSVAGLPDPAGPAAAELPPDGIAFSSMEAFGRDITGELVTAARKGGIIPGLYFSNIDWFDPDMRIDQWNAVAASGHLCDGMACDPKLYNASTDPAQWRRFVLRHRAQVLQTPLAGPSHQTPLPSEPLGPLGPLWEPP